MVGFISTFGRLIHQPKCTLTTFKPPGSVGADVFIKAEGADPIVAGITDKPAPSSGKLTAATLTRHQIHLHFSLQIQYPFLSEFIGHVFVETSALSAVPDKTPAVGGAGLPIASGAVTTTSCAAGCGVVAAAAAQGF